MRQEPSPNSPRAYLQAHPEALILYAVSDNAWLDGRTLGECCAQAVCGGATFFQIRDKGAGVEAHIAEYQDVRARLDAACADAGMPFAPLVINDDVEAAFACGADGVHVGQDDEACTSACATLGPDRIVGVSVQTVEQALQAQADGADYLGVGALIATPTKPDAVDVTFEQLCEICAAVDIPVVGIGGLNLRTLGILRGSGAVGAAVVSAIFAAEDITSASRALREELEHVV